MGGAARVNVYLMMCPLFRTTLFWVHCAAVVVNYRNGNKEYHKVGAVATNTRQTSSGMMDMFVRAIQTNEPPPIDGNEGYKSLDVILTAMEAAQQGKTLKIGK